MLRKRTQGSARSLSWLLAWYWLVHESLEGQGKKEGLNAIVPDAYTDHGECPFPPAGLGSFITNGGWLEYVDHLCLSSVNN